MLAAFREVLKRRHSKYPVTYTLTESHCLLTYSLEAVSYLTNSPDASVCWNNVDRKIFNMNQ